MNLKLSVLFFFVAGIFSSNEVLANEWHSHLSYHQINKVAQGDQKIFAANGNGLFSYALSDKNFEIRSRVEGLSDTGISAISWSNIKKGLLIGYSNGNLDMLTGNGIISLPDIKLKTSISPRSINNIICDGDFAWLSCSFGIVKINLKKWEVAETWIIGPQATPIAVNEIAADERYFWAATDSGIFKADRSNPNLQDYHSWMLQDQLPYAQNQFLSIAVFNNLIYTCDNTGHISLFDGIVWQTVLDGIKGTQKIKAFPNAIVLIGAGQMEIISAGSSLKISAYGNLNPISSSISPSDAVMDNSGDLWIGDRMLGLIHKTGDGSFLSVVPSSPANNNSRWLTTSGTTLYAATGSDKPENPAIPGEIHRLMDQHWSSFNSYSDSKLLGLKDILRVAPSPSAPDHFWASSREGGLLEFEGQSAVKYYNSINSPLQSVNGTCKTAGLVFDKTGNLWITNPLVKNQLHVIKSDGTWKSLSYPGIDNQFVSAGDLTISKTDTKWIIVNNTDLFALHTGPSIENTNDDIYRKTSVRSRFSNSTTTVIKGFNQLNSIAEDHDGYLWVGTENGVVLYTNPEALFGDKEFYGAQPSVDLGDGVFHPLLENINVTSIAIDGGNRKWFGTTNSGVFLFSEDGSKLIHHFNTDNSPLFSNLVTSISIMGQTGEVFFATKNGLISWMGDATEGESTFQKLYVWPNPVRETYLGDINIDGLTEQSEVKISDVAGNLVYKTISNGGRATWNGKNRYGARAGTGVYLIFCSNRDGSQSHVIKLLFIH